MFKAFILGASTGQNEQRTTTRGRSVVPPLFLTAYFLPHFFFCPSKSLVFLHGCCPIWFCWTELGQVQWTAQLCRKQGVTHTWKFASAVGLFLRSIWSACHFAEQPKPSILPQKPTQLHGKHCWLKGRVSQAVSPQSLRHLLCALHHLKPFMAGQAFCFQFQVLWQVEANNNPAAPTQGRRSSLRHTTASALAGQASPEQPVHGTLHLEGCSPAQAFMKSR